MVRWHHAGINLGIALSDFGFVSEKEKSLPIGAAGCHVAKAKILETRLRLPYQPDQGTAGLLEVSGRCLKPQFMDALIRMCLVSRDQAIPRVVVGVFAKG